MFFAYTLNLLWRHDIDTIISKAACTRMAMTESAGCFCRIAEIWNAAHDGFGLVPVFNMRTTAAGAAHPTTVVRPLAELVRPQFANASFIRHDFK